MKNDEYLSHPNLSPSDLWQNILDEVTKGVSAVSFDVWFLSLEFESLSGGTLVISTPTKSSRNVLMKTYFKNILEAASKINPQITDLEIVVKDRESEDKSEKETKTLEEEKERVYVSENKPQKKEPAPENNSKVFFNPKYTFDNFVIGPSNQFACAAAKAVAENPGTKMNPLFIYGGSGLGKTHLLHAIGNFIVENHAPLNVIYVTTDRFTNEFVSSLQNNNTSRFKEVYSKADVLIIDDIQQIIKRVQTQEQFFNLFNDLYQSGKQIVIASDKPPKELNPLEERLRSRLEWGMLVDVGIPDIETRIAILNKKAQIERFNVPTDVIEYIAEVATSDVRQMEGFLSSAVFYSSLLKEDVVSLAAAKEALKNIAKQEEETIDANKIIDIVCKFYNVKRDELLARKRTKTIAEARQIAMYLIKEFLPIPLDDVGKIFGKNHATVIYARDKISEDMKKSRRLEIQINDLKKMIEGK